MRRPLVALCALLIPFSLVACGGAAKDEAETSVPTRTLTVDPGEAFQSAASVVTASAATATITNPAEVERLAGLLVRKNAFPQGWSVVRTEAGQTTAAVPSPSTIPASCPLARTYGNPSGTMAQVMAGKPGKDGKAKAVVFVELHEFSSDDAAKSFMNDVRTVSTGCGVVKVDGSTRTYAPHEVKSQADETVGTSLVMEQQGSRTTTESTHARVGRVVVVVAAVGVDAQPPTEAAGKALAKQVEIVKVTR